MNTFGKLILGYGPGRSGPGAFDSGSGLESLHSTYGGGTLDAVDSPLWQDAAKTTAAAPGNGVRVWSYTDAAADAVAPSDSQRPLLTTVNSSRALVFDNTDDTMNLAMGTVVPALNAASGAAWTLSLVVATRTSVFEPLIAQDSPSFTVFFGNSGPKLTYNIRNGGNFDFVPAPAQDVYFAITIRWNGTTAQYSINGGSWTAMTIGTATMNTALPIELSRGGTGAINLSRVVLLEGAISDSDHTDILAPLNATRVAELNP
ncbi:hypothetical protein [Albimonas pacifica]|uniref:Concanavalin A-like lectin/glucanases superfamily protein n=1 Tax=Albimonas pacifica TaxID=1114924 RepID=A0A1I3LIX6_9RHOB|nr:hypothetical protein [Albimonas pacifica]SFI84739.1 hypothetical protein SAMN05216258_11054 [Albimonas pacifica]